jgi:hypothetical protein
MCLILGIHHMRHTSLDVAEGTVLRCQVAIALEWDAAFKGMNDPSGRAVKGVHEQAY